MGFCSNCGSEMKEGNVFCSNCGSKSANAGQQAADVGQQTVGNTQGMPNYTSNSYTGVNQQMNKPNNNKIIGMAVVGVAALAVLFILVKLFGAISTPGYEKPIKYVCDGIENGSFNTMMKAFPEYITDQLDDYYGDDTDDLMDSLVESLEDEFGKRLKVSYKITDKDKLDKDDIEELQDDVQYSYGEKVKIKEAYELEVEMKIKGSEDNRKDTSDVTVIKVGSKWYLSDRSFMGF